jgi:hypothetical protein
MYKPNKSHVIVDVLSRLPNIIKPISVFDQTIDASLFYTKLEWLNEIKKNLRIRQIEGTLFVE